MGDDDIRGNTGMRKRDLYRAAGRALHETMCGSPPSCGYDQPCSETGVDERHVRAAVNAVTDLLDTAQRERATCRSDCNQPPGHRGECIDTYPKPNAADGLRR